VHDRCIAENTNLAAGRDNRRITNRPAAKIIQHIVFRERLAFLVVLHVVVGKDLRQDGDIGAHQCSVSGFVYRQNVLLVRQSFTLVQQKSSCIRRSPRLLSTSNESTLELGGYFLHLPQMCNLTLGNKNNMGLLSHLIYPWGFLLQGLAIVHFIRRRPDTYWILVILFLGAPGAIIYLLVEALPDIGLVGQSFKVFPRRKRIGELEVAIRDNPSAGNYEELGGLYMDDGNLQRARDAFDKAISARADTLDPFYRRGVCAILLGDAAAALPDLERVVAKESDYDFQRAAGLLAHAYAHAGQKEKAEALFRKITVTSTLSETYLNFAELLASEGHNAEAREWAQKVLDRKNSMPGYLRRRERPWFRRAKEVLRRVPA